MSSLNLLKPPIEQARPPDFEETPTTEDGSTIGGGGSGDGTVGFDKMYPALVQCFGIILLGYLAGRLNVISETESKGLNTFVGTFALPALIFGSLCRLQLQTVNWWFLLSITLSKGLVFFVVLFVCLLINRRAVGQAGINAIFATQSNDFALGYPILTALYGQSRPEIPMYLYLIAPISLVLLNPVGLFLLEVQKQKDLAAASEEEGHQQQDQDGGHLRHDNASSSSDSTQQSRVSTTPVWRWRRCDDEGTRQRRRPNPPLVFKVLKGVVTNPVFFMTALGVIFGTLVFKEGHVPAIIDEPLTSLGSAFSATALFSLGLRMVGRLNKIAGSHWLGLMILIAVKTIGLPVVAKEITTLLDPGVNETDTRELSDFAFLYGTFPVAFNAFVFSSRYNVMPDVIAGGLVACTFVSAPIMYVSARLMSVRNIVPADYVSQLDSFLLDVSSLTLLATLWTGFVFVNSGRWRGNPHFQTGVLLASQALACLSAILWSLMDCSSGWKLYLQLAVFSLGVYSSRVNTAMLSVAVWLLTFKPPEYVEKVRKAMALAGLLIPVVLVVSLSTMVSMEAGDDNRTNPNFQFGDSQAIVSTIILMVSFLTTLVCLVMAQRNLRLASDVHGRIGGAVNERTCLMGGPSDSSSAMTTVPIEDLVQPPNEGNGREARGAISPGHNDGRRNRRVARYRCDSEHMEYCHSLIRTYDAPPGQDACRDVCHGNPPDPHEMTRHTVLLALLLISMFVGISFCIWTVLKDQVSGNYVELVFFDGFLNFGQGLFTFVTFGLHSQSLVLTVQRVWRRIVFRQESIVLPDWEDVEGETKQVCQTFLRHHISRCMEDVLKDVQVRFTTHRAVFRGCEMVDWLVEMGLARHRQDGVSYGRHLVKGRVIRHVDNHLNFHDDNFLYTFEPSSSAGSN